MMRLRKLFVVLASMALLVATAGAVTQKEMDKARAIAAKYYIRFVNDGSGYLDGYTPESMDDLAKKITNDKDKKNFNAFKNAGSPSDYATWDKEKLVQYWSSSFFTENKASLDAKGAENGLCKSKIKTDLMSMTVAAPTAESPVAEQPETKAVDTAKATNVMESGLDQIEDQILAEESQLTAEEEMADSLEEMEAPRENSGTWVYIMILAILVIVVILLVVYASRTMRGAVSNAEKKKEGTRNEEKRETRRENESRFAPVDDEPIMAVQVRRRNDVDSQVVQQESSLREKFAESLAQKTEEIRLLKQQVNSLENRVAELQALNARLKAENAGMKDKIENAPAVMERTMPVNGANEAGKEIYLGSVNARGIFVRADRSFNPGSSVYRLVTADGVTGEYYVVDSRELNEVAFADPGKWLAGGCVAKDIFDTEEKHGIYTEMPGNAIFEDGVWRVLRKAKIRYE